MLIGQVVDSNSAFIGKELTKYGFEIVEISSISDDSKTIKNTLKRASENADIIITTGGLGPTKDDITKQTIAEYLGVDLELNEDVLNHIKYIFEKMISKSLRSVLQRTASRNVLVSTPVRAAGGGAKKKPNMPADTTDFDVVMVGK